LSGSFQSNESPNSTRTISASRNTSRYPANCVSPCPAGAVVLPGAVFNQATLTVNLIAPSAARVERINQLDLKLQKTFRVNRVSISPVFEVFNVNNSDAIISYASTSALAGAGFLRPNSIMQPRVIGVGANLKW
jgi:hypothetical protein